jgi:4-amino-4-deoxy-L-arabinose transferase-like glycosyltransferase
MGKDPTVEDTFKPSLLAALLAAAVAVRAVAALRTAVITPDGVTFVEIARFFAEGEPAQALAFRYHPLYSFLMAAPARLGGSFAFWGQAFSVLLSAGALIPLFSLGRRMAGLQAAVAASILYAFLPFFVSIGSEVLAEGAFLFFFAHSLNLFHISLEEDRPWHGALAGLCAGLAYLARPEAVGLAAGGIVYTVGLAWTRRQARPFLHLGLAALAGMAVAFPYLWHIRVETGAWGVTKKKALSHLLNPGDPGDGSMIAKVFSDAARVGNAFLGAGSYAVVLLGLAALFLRRKAGRALRHDLFLLLPVGAWAGMGFLLVFSHGYLSRRHMIPAAVATVPLAGAGLVLLGGLAAGWLAQRRKAWTAARCRRVILATAACGLAVYGATALGPRRADKTYEIALGRAVGQVTGPNRRIVSTMPRVPYFAACRQIEFPRTGGPAEVRDYCEAHGAEFLLVDFSDPILPKFHQGFLGHFRAHEDTAFAPPGYKFCGRFFFERKKRPVRLHLFALLPEKQSLTHTNP